MAIIDPNSPALVDTSKKYWLDELANAKILLLEINKALQALISGGHQSYELDTGQSRQRVTRLEISKLQQWRSDLLCEIRDLEIACGVGESAVKIIRPGW